VVLERYLQQCRIQGDVKELLGTVRAFLLFPLLSEEDTLALIAEADQAVPRTEAASVRDYRRVAARWLVGQGGRARSQARDPQPYYAAAAERLQLALKGVEDRALFAQIYLEYAVIFKVAERNAEAADLFANLVEMLSPQEPGWATAALEEGLLRVALYQPERAIELLSPMLKQLMQHVLDAVSDQQTWQASLDLAEVSESLGYAYAAIGAWDAAVTVLDLSKSVAMRHRRALRSTPEGSRLLELDRLLFAVDRGIPVDVPSAFPNDLLGAGLSVRTRLLRAQQQSRPALDPDVLASPSIAEIAALLDEDEAVITIGADAGTIVATITAGDTDLPSDAFVIQEWPMSRWIALIGGSGDDGWLWWLSQPSDVPEIRSALAALLAAVDDVIGQRIASFVRERGIAKVVIIAHQWLHFVPWWSLPSMAGMRVSACPSAAELVRVGSHPVELGSSALAVADPTLDLPVTAAEAACVSDHLESAGVRVSVLAGKQATQAGLEEAMADVSLLHFTGHGRSDMLESNRSGLLVQYDSSGERDPDERIAILARSLGGGIRETLVPGVGLISDGMSRIEGVSERLLDYSATGTVWGLYQDEQLVKVAELWSAGDILLSDRLAKCALVFLSACQAGQSQLRVEPIDEYAGLPAAFLAAGVPIVICSLWPVSDAVAALYTDFFYAALVAREGTFDIGDVAFEAASKLRALSGEAAAGRLLAVAAKTSSPVARFKLTGYAQRLRSGFAPVFDDPFDWGAFYVVGARKATWAGTERALPYGRG
jgi:CHAT domain-containing protein/tetratricopeptide (TPR) repeat protein